MLIYRSSKFGALWDIFGRRISPEWMYRVGQKMAQFFVYLIISPNINRFLKTFYCQNQETICNKAVTIDPTTPQMCRYTTSWNIRWRTQACNATDRLRDQRWSSLACGISKQPRLKSSWLCCSGCPSTDGLSMLTIHDSQLAKESHCRWVRKSAQFLVDRAIGQWRRRFRCVVQQQGGHIGNLMWKL